MGLSQRADVHSLRLANATLDRVKRSASGESTESASDGSERPDITLGRRRFADFVVRVYLDVCKARFTNNMEEFTNAPPLESKQLKL